VRGIRVKLRNGNNPPKGTPDQGDEAFSGMQEASCELWVLIFVRRGWTNCVRCAKLRVVPAMPRRPRKSASARQPAPALRPPLKISAATRASVEKILSAFSPRQVERWARQTGFIQRRRQLKPFDFLSLMVFASWSMIAPSLEALASELEGTFSRVALHHRFTRQASEFLWKCLEWVIKARTQPKICIARLRP